MGARHQFKPEMLRRLRAAEIFRRIEAKM